MKNKALLPTLILGAIGLIVALSAGTIDLNNLFNYENQPIPNYITKDNTDGNSISDEGATLGRVLFYDKSLSINNTIACASCHKQAFAFGDTAQASAGVNGTTGRHSMRLINARFGDEKHFFWDERAATLEEQSTMPIQDHVEMGFSASNGDPDLDSLWRKLAQIDYYKPLFTLAFGDSVINEERVQSSLAQFIRSIQSFDSRFDEGRALAANDQVDFSNFTHFENMGKRLFMTPPQFDQNGNRIAGGAGCNGCHRAPEFDIDPVSGNNGVIAAIGGGTDRSNTRSPSLRDVVNPNGDANGPFMHIGDNSSLANVVLHYNTITPVQGIDPRLRPGGVGQNLNLNSMQVQHIVDFLHTLTGSAVYTDERWSSPFDDLGNLSIIDVVSGFEDVSFENDVQVYPNPASHELTVELKNNSLGSIKLIDLNGRVVLEREMNGSNLRISIDHLDAGVYFVLFQSLNASKPHSPIKVLKL